MNRVILKLSFAALMFLWMVSLEAEAEPRRKKNRNRNNRRRNNDYNDDEEESLLGQFSGDTYADFMERYYGNPNSGSSTILSSSYIDQEESDHHMEGSGDSDDEDYDNFESSGDSYGSIVDSDDEDLPPKWSDTTTSRQTIPQRTKATTTITTSTSTTTTIKSTLPVLTSTQSPIPWLTTPDIYEDFVDFNEKAFEEEQTSNTNAGHSVTEINEMYEGSGGGSNSGSGYGDDSQDDDEDREREKFYRTKENGEWPINSTPRFETSPFDIPSSTPKSSIASINPVTDTQNVTTKVDPNDDLIDPIPIDPIVIEEEIYPEIVTDSYDDSDYTIPITDINRFGPLEPDTNVPTFLYDNRILVVAIYSGLIFLLVSSILIVSIVVGVKHCRKKYGFVRVSGEDGSSTDSTASSDLPIIKKRNMMIQHKPSSGLASAGLGDSGVVRYDDAANRSHYAGGRRGSFSPMTHALPDLSLPPDDYKSEKSSKFLDFFKRKSEKNESHLNRSNNLNSSSRSSKKFENQNHRDWL